MTGTDAITTRLAEMLAANGTPDETALYDAEDLAAEGLPARTQRFVEAAPGIMMLRDSDSPTREQAAEQPWLYTGRGPTGRLRNFRAMNSRKLDETLYAIEQEANDLEALTACSAEVGSRA